MSLDKFPALLAVGTFLAITAAVAHEWGYFQIIGPDFQSLYTTYDYADSIIIAVGPAFVILTIAVGIQIAISRSDDFEVKRVAKSRLGKIVEEWYLEIIWTVSFAITILFQDETRRYVVYLLIALIIIRLVGYTLRSPKLQEFRRSPFGILAFIVPAAMMVSYGIGRDAAYGDLKDTTNLYELTLKGQSEHKVKVLRLIQKGAIIFDGEARYTIFSK